MKTKAKVEEKIKDKMVRCDDDQGVTTIQLLRRADVMKFENNKVLKAQMMANGDMKHTQP